MVDLKQEAAPVRIWTYKGNTRRVLMTWSMSLVGYTFLAKIQLSTDNSLVAFPVVLVDLPAGQIALDISSAVDTAVPLGAHKWWLDWTDTLGMVRTVQSGPYLVTEKP